MSIQDPGPQFHPPGSPAPPGGPGTPGTPPSAGMPPTGQSPYGAGPGGSPYGPGPAAPAKNSAATASLVLGIVSLVTSLLFLPSILGMIFGFIGVNRAGRMTPPVGKGKAITGIAMSAVGLLLGVGLINLFGAMSDDASEPGGDSGVGQEQADGGGDGGAQADDSDAGKNEAEANTASVGDAVRDGKFEFTVTKVETGVESIGGEYLGEEAQGQFVLVHLTVENIGDESQYFDGDNVTGYDGQGRELSADTSAAIYLDESNSFLNEINPGNKVDGVVVFDIPTDGTLDRLMLHDSMFSGGVEVTL